MLAEQNVVPTLKAYKVSGGRDDHAVLVMAEKRSQAIASAIGELDCEYVECGPSRGRYFDVDRATLVASDLFVWTKTKAAS